MRGSRVWYLENPEMRVRLLLESSESVTSLTGSGEQTGLDNFNSYGLFEAKPSRLGSTRENVQESESIRRDAR